MTKKAKREPIYFNETGYNHELKNYHNKKSLEELIDQEFRIEKQFKVDYKKDIMEQYYNMICEIYKDKNTLDLSGKKLCDLLEIDNSNIISLSARYRPYADVIKPKKDTFTLFAQTDKELYKLDYAKRLINILNESKEHIPNNHLTVYLKTFESVINRGARSEYIVDPNFIKY